MSTTTTDTTSTRWLYYVVLLPICISWRVGLANRMPIMDCDEVYNYWEPLHYLLEGNGYQTWEYAHEYALRTYAYLLPLMIPCKLLSFLSLLLRGVIGGGGNNHQWIVPLLLGGGGSTTTTTTDAVVVSSKLVLLLLLRSLLAGIMGYGEIKFCCALEETKLVTPAVARWTLFVLQTSAGLAHASGALLPSTTWTAAWLFAATNFVRQHHQQPNSPSSQKWFAFQAVTATLWIGWPFGVLVLVPLGIHVLLIQTLPLANGSGTASTMGSPAHIENIRNLLVYIVMVTVIVQTIALSIDYCYYGIWTSPNYNIFRYNAQGGGDELYGIEPTSYYIKNLLLNFNGVAPLGILSLGVVAGRSILSSTNDKTSSSSSSRSKATSLMVLLSPMYLWFAIVVPRPHKEERFLFPIYPILCLGAVLTTEILVVDGMCGTLVRLLLSSSSSKDENKTVTAVVPPTYKFIVHALLWIPMAALSSLRILALKKYYGAPLSIYAAIHHHHHHHAIGNTEKQLVCTCGEWYRFPSSFALPANHELAFLESSFKGQLPQPFSIHGSRKESQSILQPFNDQNQHEPTRYSSLEDCSYVVDLEHSTDCRFPSSATLVATAPFLDADRTTSTLHRTLYIPFLHEKGISQGTIHYQNYVLYKL